MGSDVAAAFASSRRVYEIAGEALGIDIAKLCFEGPEEALTDTQNAQPAILTTSLAYLAAALEAQVIRERPSFVAGHSLGQYTALAAAGSMSISNAVAIVRQRGRLMARAGEERPGAMAAVLGLEEATVEQICRDTGAEPANYNGPTQVVIGGPAEAVERASRMAKEAGGKVLPVRVAGAFHTSLMGSVSSEFRSLLEEAPIGDAEIPVVSNVTGVTASRHDEIVRDLSEQVTHPVQWDRSIRFMLAEGVTTFLEVGAGKALSGMLKRIAPEAMALNIDSVKALSTVSNV
jgi:[acyl-carrier-protein] S-malonyltransferase